MGRFYWCSHQESNLDYGYRKPAFYPLNYESIVLGVYTKNPLFPTVYNQTAPQGLPLINAL